jgi:hypothetical protein
LAFFASLPKQDFGFEGAFWYNVSMATMEVPHLPRIRELPATLPDDGAINIVLVEGIPIFRASPRVQSRVERLLDKLKLEGLNDEETKELDRYQDVDDYLSYLNRLIRNFTLISQPS